MSQVARPSSQPTMGSESRSNVIVGVGFKWPLHSHPTLQSVLSAGLCVIHERRATCAISAYSDNPGVQLNVSLPLFTMGDMKS